ncbi:LysR family transcriptional regulator [Trinickia acidisoli]|uniref:LysR family transcriptional regulator n=1 Tax=Trinickia acidisoli TaxID=2767482 RepID=UPI001A8F1105|nr:LysR family transcriptional regulator [Trinickia acidisoli]
MIDLNELQFFVRICEAQSFTVAAERLGVPKSSVSRALARLEKRLGVRLIERTTRSLMLTEAGELYLERCVRMLEEAEQADLAIGAMHAQPRGLLRVAASVPFARFALAPVLSDFLARYPEVRLELQLLGSEFKLGDTAADIVIRPDPSADSTMRATPLFQVRLAAYASPAYLAGRRPPETPADLREHHCIASHCCTPGLPVGVSSWRLRRGASGQEVRFEPRVSVADPTIGYLLAMTGTGIALLNQQAARADVEAGRLVRLLPDWEVEPIQLYALYASRLNASPKVSAFLEFLRERFDDADCSLRAIVSPRKTNERSQGAASDAARHAEAVD